MVHWTVRGEILNIRTSLAPHTNEFRLGKLESKLQTYLALLQASLLGSSQRMVLALHVCCRYPDVVLLSLQYGGQVKGGHSALCSAGLDL